ncbi:MAG: serine/threonine-protein kinase [Pirellulales bacterium]
MECEGDIELRSQVENLLAAFEKDSQHLDRLANAIGAKATAVAGTSATGLSGMNPIDLESHPRIGRYELLEVLGEGGMGVVYLAEQLEPVQRQVALKVIKPGMDSRQVVARFEMERQALSMMNHPNIAMAIDAGTTDDGRPFFVMELVRGLPINKFCDKHHLDVFQRLELFHAACQAVQHAHQKGIIHRDLKPSNIMVAHYDGKPVAKVIDFGIAKALHQTLSDTTLYTGLGQVIGTIEYMSPEQARLNQLDIDTRTDIYSLGTVLYELLVGTTPFDRKRLRSAAYDEMLRIVREEDPPTPGNRLSSLESLPSIAASRRCDPSRLSKYVKGELEWIVMKAMEKDRSRRYASANELAADVGRYLANEPISAGPPSMMYRFRKLASRHRLVLSSTAIVLIALVLGLVGTTLQAIRAMNAEQLAETRLTNEEKARKSAEAAKQLADQEADRANVQTKIAKQESRIADEINRFLLDDLLALSQYGAQVESRIIPDRNIRVRTLLDRAALLIGNRFSDDPVVRGRILRTLGQCYSGLGMHSKAEEFLLPSVTILEKELGMWDPATIQSAVSLAFAQLEQGEFEAVEKRLGAYKNPPIPLTLELEHELHKAAATMVVAYYDQEKYREALELSESLLPRTIDLFGEDSLQVLVMKGNIASQYEDLGDSETALKMRSVLLEQFQGKYGSHHPDIMSLRSNYAAALSNHGEYATALSLMDELEREIAEVGNADPSFEVRLSRNRAVTLHRLERNEEALDSLQKAHEKAVELEGAQGNSIKKMAPAFFDILHALGKDEEAWPWLEIEITNLKELGRVHSASYARCLGRQATLRRYDSAEKLKLHEEAARLMEEVQGRFDPETITLRSRVANFLFERGEREKSEERYRAILRTQEEGGFSESDQAHTKLNLLWSIIHRTEAPSDFDEFEQQLKRCEEFEPDRPFQAIRIRETYQTLLARKKDQNLARIERIADEQLVLCRKHLGDSHPKTVNALIAKASALLKTNRLDEGAQLLSKFTKAIENGVTSLEIVDAYRIVGEAYYDSQLHAKAIPHLIQAYKAWPSKDRSTKEWNSFWGKLKNCCAEFPDHYPILEAVREAAIEPSGKIKSFNSVLDYADIVASSERGDLSPANGHDCETILLRAIREVAEDSRDDPVLIWKLRERLATRYYITKQMEEAKELLGLLVEEDRRLVREEKKQPNSLTRQRYSLALFELEGIDQVLDFLILELQTADEGRKLEICMNLVRLLGTLGRSESIELIGQATLHSKVGNDRTILLQEILTAVVYAQISQGKYDAAIEQCNELSKYRSIDVFTSKNFIVRKAILLGWSHDSSGKPEAAKKVLSDLIDKMADPLFAFINEAYFSLVRIMHRERDYVNAKRYLDEIRPAMLKNPRHWVNMALVGLRGESLSVMGQQEEGELLLCESYMSLRLHFLPTLKPLEVRSQYLAEAAGRLEEHYERYGQYEQAAYWGLVRDSWDHEPIPDVTIDEEKLSEIMKLLQ